MEYKNILDHAVVFLVAELAWMESLLACVWFLRALEIWGLGRVAIDDGFYINTGKSDF